MLSPAAAALAPFVVPLIVAVIGLIATIVGTICGVIITQRRSDRREKEAWDRERDRERERWAREDAASTFELRRNAYIGYYEAVDRAFSAVCERYLTLASTGESGGPPDDALVDVFNAMQQMKVYGASRVVAVAQDSFNTLSMLGGSLARSTASANYGNAQEFAYAYQPILDKLLEAIRYDLGIPPGPEDLDTSVAMTRGSRRRKEEE